MITTENQAQIVSNQYARAETYYCLSTDSKPSLAGNGSRFVEMDTGKLYFFNADALSWVEWGA